MSLRARHTLGESDIAGSRWNQYIVIDVEFGNCLHDVARGTSLEANVVEGVTKVVIFSTACGSFGYRIGVCSVVGFVGGGTSHSECVVVIRFTGRQQ